MSYDYWADRGDELEVLEEVRSSTFLFRLLGRASLTSIRAGDLEIDPTSMRIVVRGNEVVVTGLEFRLIFYLAQNCTQVFTRDQLLDAVWGNQYQHAGSVNACVRRLREKLEPDPKHPTYLKTIRGVGYLLDMSGNQVRTRLKSGGRKSDLSRRSDVS